MHFGQYFKDLDVKIENKGDELVITIHGKTEKIAIVEKKLKALKELCGCCCDEDCSCC